MPTPTFKVIAIPLTDTDLLFGEKFITECGGPAAARLLLLDIINRYFATDYFDPDLVEYINSEEFKLELSLQEKGQAP